MKKKIIDQIDKCYSVNALQIGGKTQLVFAGEGDGSLSIYAGEDFKEKKTIWEEKDQLGGTMTICAVEDKEGYFFASTGFFTMIQSQTSSIYLVRYKENEFERVKVCDIPYLHRFDVVTIGEMRYLIACTIHSGKSGPEDWSNPGKLLVAELPYDLDGEISVSLKVLKEGLVMNHGFNRIYENGETKILIAAKNGVFQITPPFEPGGEWEVEQIFDFPASDVCAFDLDGDGNLEYGILSPFHGDHFSVYKKMNGMAVKVYEHAKELDFYHAIYADVFEGQPSFIIGARKKDMDLYRVFYDTSRQLYETELIETGAGSSNARIIHTGEGDLIMSANRQKNEAAVYMRE